MRRLLLTLLAFALCAPANAQTPFNAYNNLGFDQGDEFLMDSGTALFNNVMGATGNNQIFFNSSGTFAGSSSFVYTSAGRLGIGTATPAYTLDVTGTGNISGAVTIGGTLGVTGQVSYSSGADFGATIRPTVNDGAALGTSTYKWGDLYLAAGSVIDVNNGDITVTASTNTWTFAGATSGWRFANGPITPSSDGAISLGDATRTFQNLYMNTSAAIDFEAGDVAIVHSTDRLDFRSAGSYVFDAPVTATSFVGNSTTASALAANGTNCSAGQYPLGVDASGNAESCTVAGGGSVAGSDRQIQFNSGGSFGALSGYVLTSAGKMGLGVASPAYLMDVNGTARFSSAVNLYAGSAASPALTFSSDTNTGIYTSGADNISLVTGGTARLTLGSTGTATFSSGANFTGTVSVTDDAYASSWNGSANVPTKNAVYDKIETISSGTPTLGTPTASTSGTSVSYTGLTCTRWLRVTFNTVSLSGSDQMVLQFGSAGGYATSGYRSVASNQTGQGSVSSSGIILQFDAGSGRAYDGEVTASISNSNGTWVVGGGLSRTDDAGQEYVHGRSGPIGTLDRFRLITTGSNTFDSGEVNYQCQ